MYPYGQEKITKPAGDPPQVAESGGPNGEVRPPARGMSMGFGLESRMPRPKLPDSTGSHRMRRDGGALQGSPIRLVHHKHRQSSSNTRNIRTTQRRKRGHAGLNIADLVRRARSESNEGRVEDGFKSCRKPGHSKGHRTPVHRSSPGRVGIGMGGMYAEALGARQPDSSKLQPI